MSSQKSESTVDSELASEVLERLGVTADAEYNLAQLYEATAASSLIALDRVLWALVERGQVKVRYRVRSPYGEHLVIDHFDHYSDIPPALEDMWLEPPQPFRVEADDIDIVFRRQG